MSKSLRHATLPGLILMALLASALAGAAELPRQADKAVELRNGELVLPISLACPQFSFNSAVVGGSQAPARVSGSLADGGELVAEYEPVPIDGKAKLEVKMHFAWNADEGVLRKWVEYRVNPAPDGCVLHEIKFDQLAPVAGQPIVFLPAPPQSLPGFLRGFFAGIEFPVACTRLEGNDLVVAQRPGRALRGDTGWLVSRKAMYGPAPVGREREAFSALIARHRPKPGGLHFNYNSWYTLPWPYSEQMILDLMKKFQDNLTTPYGANFDSFAIDMGWSDLKTMWEINKPMFPDGFTKIRARAEAMHSRLGMWISPSSCYPPALDNEWAKAQGYETYLGGGDGKFRACCLGGPKYAEAFKNRLVSIAVDQGVRHLKLDGYWFGCNETDHGHQPGPDSAEATAEGGIRAFEAVRAAVPDIWLEPTCFGPNPSPWWLYYVNSVTGTFGDDNPPPRCPCPIDREAMTSGRDFFNLQGAALLPLPIVAQEVLGINHQTEHPLLNDAVTVVLRGHAFLPAYINPRNMTPRRWAQFAGLVKWARANEGVLAETRPILPEAWRDGKVPHFTHEPPMPRQPYGYAHWVGDRGLVLLRNPWIQQQTVSLELGKDVGVSEGAKELSAVSLYPEPRLYGRALNAQSKLDVTLAPYETILLSLAAGQETAGLPEASERVCASIKTKRIATQTRKLSFEQDKTPSLGPDWTRQMTNVKDAVEFTLDGKVWGGKDQNELLVILEGKEHSPVVITPQLLVNGKAVALTESHSEVIWKATGLPNPEYWTILKAPLVSGKNKISLKVLCDTATTKASCWAWSYRNTADEPTRYPNQLPYPEQIYLNSTCLFEGAAVAGSLPVESRTRPVEHIDGVYLDTMTPVEAKQDFGTLQNNASVNQQPLHICQRFFPRGIGTHANARIVYSIPDQGFTRFQTWLGADSEVTASSITFTILVDGAKRYESGLMTAQDAPRFVDIDVKGGKTLELLVGDSGNGIGADHADFGEARLVRSSDGKGGRR